MFRFLHTADWQLGKPFGGFEPELGSLLREARLTAIDRLAAAARAAEVRHVLVAGDVFDAPTVPPRVLGQALEKLARHRDLVWHLLPGNHDAAQAGSVWERLTGEGAPANVVAHLTPAAREIEPGVMLLAAPLLTRAAAGDPTEIFDRLETAAGVLRIGLAHGSVREFGSETGGKGVIDPTRPARAGLDYLALGDWHGVLRIGPRLWYSGTPEPDRYPDNEPGFALVVTIAGPGAAPEVRRVATRRYAWARRQLDLSGRIDLDALDADVAALAPAAEDVLLELALAGHVPLVERTRIDEWVARQRSRLCHLDADLSALRLTPAADDLAAIGSDGVLRAAAGRLAAMIERGERSAVAGRALTELAALAAEAERGPS